MMYKIIGILLFINSSIQITEDGQCKWQYSIKIASINKIQRGNDKIKWVLKKRSRRGCYWESEQVSWSEPKER